MNYRCYRLKVERSARVFLCGMCGDGVPRRPADHELHVFSSHGMHRRSFCPWCQFGPFRVRGMNLNLNHLVPCLASVSPSRDVEEDAGHSYSRPPEEEESAAPSPAGSRVCLSDAAEGIGPAAARRDDVDAPIPLRAWCACSPDLSPCSSFSDRRLLEERFAVVVRLFEEGIEGCDEEKRDLRTLIASPAAGDVTDRMADLLCGLERLVRSWLEG